MTSAGPVDIEIRDFPVPDPLRDRAREWFAALDHGHLPQPVPARPASTVMLVRDGQSSPEVFMLRRVSTMEFAPNMWVFPGGGVDDRDADPSLPWTGPSPRQWAQALVARSETEARELVIAAAREVFEEVGVLLAGPDEHTVVADVSSPDWAEERAALLNREQSFGQLLIKRGLTLRTDLLRARAHWITPEFEPRRYDTRFFAALLPEGQVADDATTEAETSAWARADDLLADLAAGRALMFPPTKVCLEQVAAANSAQHFLDTGPAVRVIMPVLTRDGEHTVMRTELPL